MSEAASAPLGIEDAPRLAALLQSQPAEYLAHFTPFAFDEQTIAEVLQSARNDRFWSLQWNGELAGFYMLRGLDQGYSRPAFGVFVAERFAGKGLARLALTESIRWCREQNCPALMLKVSPENPRAYALYVVNGFEVIGPCERTGHTIMELRLK
jgi:RimJ/RimL family protein N-acetyltransferase